MSFGVIASSYVAGGGGPTGDSPYATALLSDSPLVYLPLNETSGTTAVDNSGNSRDATYDSVVLGQYSVISGSTGHSVRSDSQNCGITIPHAPWMDTAEMTVLISCIIYPGSIRMLVARYASDGSPNANSWFVDVGSGGTLWLYWRTSTGSDVAVNSGVTPVEGKRLLVAAYVNATESGIRVYEDGGVLLAAATGTGGSINVSNVDLTLYKAQQPNYGLIGYLDDFALFGTALTTARMDQLATLAFTPHETWVAKTEGTAPRNGTANHTINFTPAANGSLLVAVIGGSVTHTMVTAGWTKQLGPVWDTELAVFTKTASAGESSLQVMHNGANYPVEYAVYEFAAGSSYYTGAGAANGGPFPTLSGLPGTSTTVFAATSMLLGDTYSPYVINWRYFWRTSVNRNTLYDDGTAGSFLNVGYFAFNDFPDANASVDTPGPQYDYLFRSQAVMFAIQHT